MTLRWYSLTLVMLGCVLLACSSSTSNNPATGLVPDGPDEPQVVIDEDVIVTEPGSGFDDAPRVQFDAANRMVIDNVISTPQEVHVYDLGPLAMGDRIETIAIDKAAEGFDPMIAMFDADGLRIFWNDDVNPQTGNFSAFFTGSIRHDSPSYFLAISSSSYSMTTGQYRVTVDLTPERALAPIKGQTVVLQWDAVDDVYISNVSYGDIDTVRAESVSTQFSGRTQEFKDTILGIVRKDFAAFDVNVLSSDDEVAVANYSEVFFGEEVPPEFHSAKIFGSSDGIDFYNASDQDNAIVFLGAFSGLASDFEAVAQAVANVISHEIGHTLGLMHTVDATTIMDTAGADNTLLQDQIFGTARMFDFPIGLQNSDQLLEETVGRAAAMFGKAPSWDDDTPRCGTCGASLFKVAGTDLE